MSQWLVLERIIYYRKHSKKYIRSILTDSKRSPVRSVRDERKRAISNDVEDLGSQPLKLTLLEVDEKQETADKPV